MRAVRAVAVGSAIVASVMLAYNMHAGFEANRAKTVNTALATDDTNRMPLVSAADFALAELRQELGREADGTEHATFRTDEQRLEEAKAWVEANRKPDWPYRELEGKVLALMDIFAESEGRSAAWVMHMALIEIEMIRSLDINQNGHVCNDEVLRFVDENISSIFNPVEHPYLRGKFDADSNGVVDEHELADLASTMSEGALAGVFARGKLEAWDTDNNGFLSEKERLAGEKKASATAREIFGELWESGLGDVDWREEGEAGAEVVGQGKAVVARVEAARTLMIDQVASEALLEAMRLDNLASPDQAALMRKMPTLPDKQEFDIDRDGIISAQEAAVRAQVVQEYQREVQQWSAEMTAYRLKAQFDHAIRQSDTDADGRLSKAEWKERIDNLLFERDTRLFLQSYDLDRSGRVEADELLRYIAWYRSGSLRADANYDGIVDGRDLERMARKFQRQGVFE